MKILIANIGSTSFKYKLFDMPEEKVIARGGIERIGKDDAKGWAQIGENRLEVSQPIMNHGEAIEIALRQLTDAEKGVLGSTDELNAIGFKAVHAHNVSGVQIVDDAVLDAMETYRAALPAHNPPYIAAMRMFKQVLPDVPQVAAFETAFHQTIPLARQLYAVPYEWYEQYGIRRYGFHGASHRYIATRTGDLFGRRDLRVISCHLGGSSSICAIKNGKSVATSMGFTTQSGLPQSNRMGDLDASVYLVLCEKLGRPFDDLMAQASREGGLLGISGVSNDVRDIEEAIGQGNSRAKLALESFVEGIRHYLGAYYLTLGGLDLLVFTGGIGENSASVREMVCADLDFMGIKLDQQVNRQTRGTERPIHRSGSPVQIWTIPTNEELIVARQSYEKLTQSKTEAPMEADGQG